jgi:ketopantoate reductase
MRFLIVGAGALGGYYGGMLLKGGADVTFLVREQRSSLSAGSSSSVRPESSIRWSRRHSRARSRTVTTSCFWPARPMT